MFIIFGLPRSRTFWLSQFLSYNGRITGHDLSGEVRSVGEYSDFVQTFGGTCDTGAVVGWRALREALPEAKFVTIRRPIPEVNSSLQRIFGTTIHQDDLVILDAMLDALESSPGTLRFDYRSLRERKYCSELFEHCLEVDFNSKWWEDLNSRNLQVNLHVFLENLPRRVENFQILQLDMYSKARGGSLN